jgi:sialidase-1
MPAFTSTALDSAVVRGQRTPVGQRKLLMSSPRRESPMQNHERKEVNMKLYSGKIFALIAFAFCAMIACESISTQMIPQVERRTVVAHGGGYFPVLIRLHTGRLIVVYRYGAPHISVKGELAVSWSDDDGKTWSSPAIAASGKDDHRNPAMVELPDGDILVSYCIMDGYDTTGRRFRSSVDGKDPRTIRPLWTVRSHDHGATWGAPQEMKGTQPLVQRGEMLNAYGKMAVMHDGSVLMSVYGSWMGHHSSFEHIFRSTDSGRTWSLFSTVAEQVNETGILALPDHHVLAAMRTNKEQELVTSLSDDGGKTWDTPTPVTKPNEHPGDLIQLQNGDVLLTFGERNAPRGASAILSHDGGKSWDQNTRMVLADDAPLYDCGYPSSVQLPDGRIVTVYYKVDDAATAPASTTLRMILWKLPQNTVR